MLGEVQLPTSHSALARGSERNFGNSLGGRGRVAKAGGRCLEKGPKISLFLQVSKVARTVTSQTSRDHNG